MKKRIITSLLLLGIVPIIVFGESSCTFEDILNHSSEKHKELDKGKNNEKDYDFIITPENTKGDFRTFLQNIVNSYSNILIKGGTYEIELTNEYRGIRPQNGSTITFESNAKIKVKPNRLNVYSVIDLRSRSNITIINPNIEGDKYTHLGTTGEWGNGINISDCDHIRIINARISKMWGDGMYIKNCNNVEIHNTHILDNRRQGISIISGNNIKIHNIIVEDTGGTLPGYGINIEPNWNGENVTGLKLYNPIFRNNGNKTKGDHMVGFCLTTKAINTLKPTQKKLIDTNFDIEIFDPIFDGNMLFITPHSDYVKGAIKVYRPKFYNSKGVALYFRNHQSDFFETLISDPKFINCVNSPQNSVDLAPIVFHCTEHLSIKKNGTKNITILNPKIETDKNKTDIPAIYSISSSNFTDEMKNVTIKNLLVKGYKKFFYNPRKVTLHQTFSINFDLESTFPDIQSEKIVSNTFDNIATNYTGNSKNAKILLDSSIPVSDAEFYYANNSKDKSSLKLVFNDENHPPKTYTKNWELKKIRGIELPYGTYIRLKKIKVNHWQIISPTNLIKPID